MGDAERKCLPRRSRALPVPRSTSSTEVSQWNYTFMKKQNITLQEERQEGDKEHQENGDDTSPNPVKDRDEVVTTRLAPEDIALRVYFTNSQLLVQSADIKHCGYQVRGET